MPQSEPSRYIIIDKKWVVIHGSWPDADSVMDAIDNHPLDLTSEAMAVEVEPYTLEADDCTCRWTFNCNHRWQQRERAKLNW